MGRSAQAIILVSVPYMGVFAPLWSRFHILERRLTNLPPIVTMTERRFATLRFLMESRPTDFAMIVEMGSDRIHHAFWRFIDPEHRLYEPGNRYEHVVRDYYLQLDLGRNFDRLTPFATAGYKFAGESEEFDLDDVAYGSVGCDYRIERGLNAGLSLDGRQASTAASDPMLELVGYVNWGSGARWSFMTYAVAGLADGSPDTGIGLQVSVRQ